MSTRTSTNSTSLKIAKLSLLYNNSASTQASSVKDENRSEELSGCFVSPHIPQLMIKREASAYGHQSSAKKVPKFGGQGLHHYNTHAQQMANDEQCTDDEQDHIKKDSSISFNTPNSIIYGGSSSPRNAIEKQFSLNLKMYQMPEETQQSQFIQAQGKTRLVSEEPIDTGLPWYHYDIPDGAGGSCMMLMDPDFNELNLVDDYQWWLPTVYGTSEECSPSGEQSNLLTLKKLESCKSNSSLDDMILDSTADKASQEDLSATLQITPKQQPKPAAQKPRRVPLPQNRFEKTLDQTLVLENEFKKSSSWSKNKMQQLAQILNLTVSQVYKWNWDRRQSNSYHYFKLCSAPLKPRKQLFSVVRMARDRKGDTMLFQVKRTD